MDNDEHWDTKKKSLGLNLKGLKHLEHDGFRLPITAKYSAILSGTTVLSAIFSVRSRGYLLKRNNINSMNCS